MRRVLFLALAMFTQPALAGDWASPTLEARHSGDWSGGYVGAYGGLAVSPGRAVLEGASGVLLPTDVQYGLFPRSIGGNTSGIAAGVGAGFNAQSGAFVGGIEADIGYIGTSARHSYSRVDIVPGSPFPGVDTNTSYSTDFGLLGTVRARGGFAFGDTMIYGTAGLAAGNVKNRLTLALPPVYTSPDWSGSGMRFGYTLGIGVEQRVTSNVSLKFETLYVNLADRVVHGTDPAAFPGERLSYRFKNDVVIPRLSLNVKF